MAQATISITVNGEAKEVAADQTGVQLFAEDKNIIAVRLNGEPRDLYTELHDGDVVEPIALDSEDGLAIMRHSATHVMAQAVQEIRPDAKLGIGPVIKDGFYYDFDVKDPFTPEDLKEIEKRMQRIIKSSQSFRRRVVTEEEALAEEADQPYKLELIKDKEAHLDPEAATEISGKELSFYDNVDREGNVVWKDLCRGPHVPSTKILANGYALMRTGGFALCAATDPVLWRCPGNPYRIPRLPVGRGSSEAQFALQLSGALAFLKNPADVFGALLSSTSAGA